MTHIDDKNMICQECGMIVHPKEFHPYEFCILHKAGQDTRNLYNRIVEHIKQDEEGEKA